MAVVGKTIKQRGRGGGSFTGEGGSWLKESTPMETNKILVLNFSFCLFVWFCICFLFTSESPP